MCMSSLKSKIAVVTGASRGAGRGIAYELGRAGATVYVTGRSTQESSTDDRPETIEQTATEVTARGGHGIAVRCDHTDPDDINRLVQQIHDQHGRIDLLVNSVFGGSEASLPPGQGKRFWERPPEHWDAMMVAGPKAYLLTTRAAVPLLQQSPAALIVNLTSFSPNQAAGNLYYDLAMQSINRMTCVMGQELRTSLRLRSVPVSCGRNGSSTQDSEVMRPRPPLTSDELSSPWHRIRISCNRAVKPYSSRNSPVTMALRIRTGRNRYCFI